MHSPLSRLIGFMAGNPNEKLEYHLFNSVLFVSGLLNIGGSLTMFLLPYGTLLFVLHLTTGLVFIGFWFASKNYGLYERLFWPTIVLVLAFLSVNWITNAGSQGGAHYYFITVVIVVVMLRYRQSTGPFLLILTTTMLLLGVEYVRPAWIIPHADRGSRYLDIFLNFSFVMFLCGALVLLLTNELERERRKEGEYERRKNAALASKNDELESLLAELKATQEQLIHQEKMASLGRVTAGIAHEIRNPLNFINNFSLLSVHLLEELAEALDPPAGDDGEAAEAVMDDLRQNLERIRNHGRRADDIIGSMMEHARGGHAHPRPTDLNALVEEYLMLSFHSARARNDDIDVSLDRHYDPRIGEVSLIPHLLCRALLNLFENAFIAVEERWQVSDATYTPMVSVHTRRAGDAVEIEVIDNGPGMPEDVRAKAFEPFFTTRPPGKGTGLGLSLAYDIIVHTHGGMLTVEDRPGVSTALKVRLPYVATAASGEPAMPT